MRAISWAPGTQSDSCPCIGRYRVVAVAMAPRAPPRESRAMSRVTSSHAAKQVSAMITYPANPRHSNRSSETRRHVRHSHGPTPTNNHSHNEHGAASQQNFPTHTVAPSRHSTSAADAVAMKGNDTTIDLPNAVMDCADRRFTHDAGGACSALPKPETRKS